MPSLLLVEDDAAIRTALQLALTRQGHQVATAASGEEALANYKSVRPDLIVLDVMLPGVDGFEVARRLKREHGDAVRIIAISAYGTENDRRQSLEAGCEVHLMKPADPRFIESLLG